MHALRFREARGGLLLVDGEARGIGRRTAFGRITCVSVYVCVRVCVRACVRVSPANQPTKYIHSQKKEILLLLLLLLLFLLLYRCCGDVVVMAVLSCLL